jgi:molybdopterin converting factor small subunit
MGTFKEAAGRPNYTIDICSTINALIIELIKELGNEFRNTMLDPLMDNPLPNALILVNGIEINNLKGLDTPISEDDEIVLLSVTHGG